MKPLHKVATGTRNADWRDLDAPLSRRNGRLGSLSRNCRSLSVLLLAGGGERVDLQQARLNPITQYNSRVSSSDGHPCQPPRNRVTNGLSSLASVEIVIGRFRNSRRFVSRSSRALASAANFYRRSHSRCQPSRSSCLPLTVAKYGWKFHLMKSRQKAASVGGLSIGAVSYFQPPPDLSGGFIGSISGYVGVAMAQRDPENPDGTTCPTCGRKLMLVPSLPKIDDRVRLYQCIPCQTVMRVPAFRLG
jgi:hypothetical protein